MSNFIYSKMSGKNDAMYGKFEHPIKMAGVGKILFHKA